MSIFETLDALKTSKNLTVKYGDKLSLRLRSASNFKNGKLGIAQLLGSLGTWESLQLCNATAGKCREEIFRCCHNLFNS